MKKRIILIFLLLFLTGCTCEYNLTIDSDIFLEEIILTSNEQSEINEFNKKWQIPVDYEIYSSISEESTELNAETYKYEVLNNQLKLKYSYNSYNYKNSTAVKNCFNQVTAMNYDNSIVISTSNKNNCFEKYPYLESIKVNITTDKIVTSNNATSVNGSTYTWILTKKNANDFGINLVVKNEIIDKQSSSSSSDSNNKNKKSNDYGYYIFFLILLIITLVGYSIYKKNNNDKSDLDD